MENDLIKSVRLRWLLSLFEFSHINFQKKVWLEAAVEDYISDYNEAICQYFDDLNLNSGFEKFIEEGFANQNEYKVLNEFHKTLCRYSEKPEKQNLSDKNILRDNEWIELTQLAFKNWNQLKNIIQDSDELNYMLELELKYKV